MKLHLDKSAFSVLLEDVHANTGYRTDVLEKDYYVTLILKELALKQEKGLKAYFKGGTALYKALKTTNRFSEDIDISVDTRDCSRTQNDKRLEQATKQYTVLPRIPNEGRTNRSEVISVYNYEPVVSQAYEVMQRQYVMRAADRIPFNDVTEIMLYIQKRLEQNSAWRNYTLKSLS